MKTEHESGKSLLVTIDGPAGAGKTTVSRTLAQKLGYRYIDTGALYRGIALAAREAQIEADDDHGLKVLCDEILLDIESRDGEFRLMLNGSDVSVQIRSPGITMLASAVSARPVVRAYLLNIQRTLGAAKKAVFEGRDMGTVVFPDADVKFFLDADPNIRARRRFDELQAEKGLGSTSLDAVSQDMAQRDINDSTRHVAPLKAAADAHYIDSTGMGVDEVVGAMIAQITCIASR
jgi:cytidylate kinase